MAYTRRCVFIVFNGNNIHNETISTIGKRFDRKGWDADLSYFAFCCYLLLLHTSQFTHLSQGYFDGTGTIMPLYPKSNTLLTVDPSIRTML